METTHPQQSEVTDEKELPKFRRCGNNYYRLCKDGNYLEVGDHLNREGMDTVGLNFVLNYAEDDCTEEEFQAAYKKVSQILEERAR